MTLLFSGCIRLPGSHGVQKVEITNLSSDPLYFGYGVGEYTGTGNQRPLGSWIERFDRERNLVIEPGQSLSVATFNTDDSSAKSEIYRFSFITASDNILVAVHDYSYSQLKDLEWKISVTQTWE